MKGLYSSFHLAASFLPFPAKPSPQQPHGVKPYDCCKRLRGRRLANVKEAIPSPRTKRLKKEKKTDKQNKRQQVVTLEDNGELILCNVETFLILYFHY